MHPNYRAAFNAAFSDELYHRYERLLTERLGHAEFRLAETPVFLTKELSAKLVTAAREVLELLSRPELLERMKAAIPERFDVPGMDAFAHFTQVDFAIVRE